MSATTSKAVIRPDVLNEELASVRRALYYDLGVPFPGISLRINEQVKGERLQYPDPGGAVRRRPVACAIRAGTRDARKIWTWSAFPTSKKKPFLPRIDTIWVDVAHRARLCVGASIPFMEPVQILSYHIAHILRRYADEFIGIQETRFLLSRMEDRFPELVKEVQRIVPLQKTSEIFQRLVSEGVSVRNMRTILTALIDWGQKEKDTVLLTEYVRGALKRQICYRYSSGMNILPAYVLTPELEDTVRNAIRQTSAGSYLALDPRVTKQIVDKVRKAMGDVTRQPRKPVLLTSMDIRRYMRKIIEVECQDLPVLSYQELTTEIAVQPLAKGGAVMADDVVSVVSDGPRTTEARPLLHVVSGANQGAEAPLDDGAWVIGTGADADLTFAEPALAEAQRPHRCVRVVTPHQRDWPTACGWAAKPLAVEC